MNKETIRPEFQYLNMVRDHGSINMFGAAQHLALEFGIDRREAKQILLDWMKWVDKKEVRDGSV